MPGLHFVELAISIQEAAVEGSSRPGLRTSRPSALAAIVLPGDQLSVPSKQRVWRHQGVEPEKPFSTYRIGLDCESTALRIRESQSLPAELLSEHPILRLQVLDHILLAAVHPSGEEQHQELQLRSVY
jgi:hypothetical protein